MTHGTRSAYVTGCRCASCTAANTDYERAWRLRTGRVKAYSSVWCRCVWCTSKVLKRCPTANNQLFCSQRCRQAFYDHRRYGCGTPGIKPGRRMSA